MRCAANREILNEMAKTLPKVYYGLHFYPGVAEYREPGKEPYRIFVGEDTIKNMGPTFQGRPVYVEHVDEVNLENLHNEADGYVMESFFNKADGKHWVKFIVVSDRGHEAIRMGWKLSNAYIPKEFAGGGLCNGVEYTREVTKGEYEHLAIVRVPRYEESTILTPDQFKEYNTRKELELSRLTNSKGEKSMLNFFKKAKVENSADLEATVVVLPKSKKEMTITQLVNEMDAIHNMHGYASEDHMVKVGENEMSVKELVKKHSDCMNELEALKNPKKENEGDEEKKENADDEEKKENGDDDVEAKKKLKELEAHEDKEIAAKKGNEGEDEKKENEDDKKEEKEVKKNHFTSLKNAHHNQQPKTVDLSEDKVARGKARYGSK